MPELRNLAAPAAAVPPLLQAITPLAPPLAALRRRYTDEAFAYLPRLLQLVDRNPYSRTYGSFDRSYWHYRTMDFPCGMYQEFCLPLAMAYAYPFEANPYHGKQRVRELALAGIDFARRSAHPDGTCDDYFPFERALGALVFSLHAMTESCLVLGERREADLEFFSRRADHLMAHNESGQLSNHQALAALALYNTFLVTGDSTFERGAADFVEICHAWYHPEEGWFQEYEGADPGYQSCTVAFMAKLYKRSGNQALLPWMQEAAEFCRHFMQPDGSYAGEYGSRNTYHFYPHGFEVLGAAGHQPSREVADLFLLRALPQRSRYFNDDDRMCAHYLYDWMQAYLDFGAERSLPAEQLEAAVAEGAGGLGAREAEPLARPLAIGFGAPAAAPAQPAEPAPAARWFRKAGLLVWSAGDAQRRAQLTIALNKGGSYKITDARGPVASDTGIILEVESRVLPQGAGVLVSHLVDDKHAYECAGAGPHGFERAVVSGVLSRRKQKLATPATQIAFRLLNLTLGRFAPNLLRATLQKILITGKARSDWQFERVFEWEPNAVLKVTTRLHAPAGARVRRMHFGSDATSIYVANSNVYQRSVLLPWAEQAEMVEQINRTGRGESIVRHALGAAPAAAAAAHSAAFE